MAIKILLKNSRAGYDFFLEEKVEAGLVLKGTEVKSLRDGGGSLQEAFVQIDSAMEAWLYNFTIPHYTHGNIHNHEESRKRKLLLNKREILHLAHTMKIKSMTLIPTMIYFKNGKVKVEIALAKGKKLFDKREAIAKKDSLRKIGRGEYE
jgi:SsrA-binding protein